MNCKPRGGSGPFHAAAAVAAAVEAAAARVAAALAHGLLILKTSDAQLAGPARALPMFGALRRSSAQWACSTHPVYLGGGFVHPWLGRLATCECSTPGFCPPHEVPS